MFAHDVDLTTHGHKDAVDRHLADFMKGGYRALDELRDTGAIKAIGAGVNEWEAAEAFASAGDFDVFMLAGRYTLLEQDALTSFLPLCWEKGIGVVVGGPFNSGILATGPKADAHYNYRAAPDDVKERVRRIQQICKAFKVKLPEAALHFPLGHPAVVSVTPGVEPRERSQTQRRDDDDENPARLMADAEGREADPRGRADAEVTRPLPSLPAGVVRTGPRSRRRPRESARRRGCGASPAWSGCRPSARRRSRRRRAGARPSTGTLNPLGAPMPRRVVGERILGLGDADRQKRRTPPPRARETSP